MDKRDQTDSAKSRGTPIAVYGQFRLYEVVLSHSERQTRRRRYHLYIVDGDDDNLVLTTNKTDHHAIIGELHKWLYYHIGKIRMYESQLASIEEEPTDTPGHFRAIEDIREVISQNENRYKRVLKALSDVECEV